MNARDSTTRNCENLANGNLQTQWERINWKEAETSINGLQVRIAKATKEGRWNLVTRLQYLLTHSFFAKALAVRTVTQNRGKRTAGVDGEIWITPAARMKAVLSLTDKRYKAKPLRRIYIPKPGKSTKRPLSIPSMYDRAMQALYAMALSPVAETLADSTSFGFRKFRSAHDACDYAYNTLHNEYSAEWILEADIKGCFDNISHEWLIENIPMDKSILKQFLKAGFVFNRHLFSSDRGTPQGGVISPILANMTLDGIEKMLAEEFWTCPRGRVYKPKCNKRKVNLTRYADDLIITADAYEIAVKIKDMLTNFLKARGLELSEEKTKITHIKEGFHFLGWTFRKLHGKLLVKPSKESIKRINDKVGALIREARAWTQDNLIQRINPIIQGWANYHRYMVSKRIFTRQDHILWNQLYSWAKRRHPDKSKQWLKNRYWHRDGKRDWIFETKISRLISLSYIPTVHYRMVILEKNPYLDQEYFRQRILGYEWEDKFPQMTLFQFPIFELPDT
ncbi:MAG: group II intron reverse transcriptase/maturase [Methanospirillum sp.]|uniref:group II intron reverse transcriptase/maturase n=1 Tax=Methanospirillum sp. TaxID=45200 RepID=UPI00236B42EB|nr:group II intron reverse transcriptase/maturase [Methanospirillum sp.]MDD1729073.1 group II intron reverse transcriptase/maturase [Methanospirillum sp.]